MTRLARPLARAAVALVGGLMLASILSLLLPGTERIENRPSLVDFLSVTAVIAAFPAVGYAIVNRRPANGVGWLFLLVGVTMAGATFTSEYADRVAQAGADLPAANLAAWLSGWLWTIGPMVALPGAILLFPDGRLLSTRWRQVVTLALALPILTIASVALAPGDISGYEGRFANPFGLPGPLGQLAAAVSGSQPIGFAAFVVPGALAVVATVVRMRRARHAERQQLKWLVYPVGVFVGAIAIAVVLEHPLAWTAALVSLAGVPIGAGIAILRYRLYDIDVVIRRTLIYGGVVAILAVVYVTLVLGLQGALTGLTGGQTLPVAVSTLAIAALFGPVRSRVRAAVDRRFYRSQYDAQRTLEAFAARLRDEVELETVGQALAGAADRAVRPASVAVWVRDPSAG